VFVDGSHPLELSLAQVVDDTGAKWISKHVDGGAEPVKEPVNREDDGDIFRGETHGVEDHDHGDEPGLGNPCSANTGCGGRDGDGTDLANGQLHAIHLRDEDSGHGLVQGRTVHVDGRTNRKNEPEHNLQMRGSTPFLSSRRPMVTGRVALEEPVPKAVVKALAMLAMNVNGNIRVHAV